MTPDEWEKVSEVFQAAAEIDPVERDAFLDRACGNDKTMRLEVESLLAAESEAGDFIGRPVIEGLGPPDAEPPSVSLIGAVLGHYRVERRIGSGGMGDVFLATDMRLNRAVALKTLPSLFANDAGFLRRFRNEAQAAATLNHPNVATIYSVEDIDGRPVITMEYVEGKTLDSFIPEGGIEIDTFLDWFRSLADALVHAHEKGVIHRDIKPGNTMIAADGTPKILDFGLARIEARSSPLLSEELHITHPGQVIGTPSYMSPEQAEGKDVDARTDIFSFGILMYEAITGIKPFKGDSHAEVVSNLLKVEPPSVAGLRPGLPPLLARLIEKCLSKKRRNRHQSMREVRAILDETRSAEMRPHSMDSFQRKLLARQPASPVAWIMAGIFLLIVAGAGYFYYSSLAAPSPIGFENMTLRRLSQTNNVVFAHITADGRSVAYNTIEENETRAMWIRRVDDRNALQLLPPQPVQFWGGLTSSADGSNIYYITAPRAATHGTLYRISSLGGQPRKLVETVNDVGSLSPNGERILYIRYGETADIVSANAADGGDERVLHSAANGSLLRDPQFSPDGKLIYAIRFDPVDGSEYWSLIEIPAAGGTERVLIPRQKPKISEIAVLQNGSGLLLNATDPVSNLPQVYHFSPAGGDLTRITNDLHSYFGISVDAAGETVVTAQRNDDRWIWAGPASDLDRLERVSSGPNAYASVAWTPDGRIVYDTVDNDRRHITRMDADGGGILQLTGEDTNDFQPRVSPDGRYIVFTSDRSGSRRVWRMNIDGGNPVRLSPEDAVADSPVISSDGPSVYFHLLKNNERKLGRVSINGGETTEMPLFGEGNWAISPEGGRVAYAFRDAGGAAKVGVRTLASPDLLFAFESSPIYILKWARDGQSLIYRERDIGENPYATVWIRSLRQKEPRVFYRSQEDNVLDISESPDGKMIAMVRTKLSTNAVMLTRTASR